MTPDPARGGTHGSLSLFWPPGIVPSPAGAGLDAQALADLDMAEVIGALSGTTLRHERFVRDTLCALCSDPVVIAYRAATLDELLADATLRDGLRRVLPDLDALSDLGRPRPGENALVRLTQRLSTLELFVDVVGQLRQVLGSARRRAPALQALQQALDDLASTPAFVAVQAELPDLRRQVSGVRSVTIGVNLSDDLRPASAALLALHEEPIAGRATWLDRLLGGQGDMRGLTPLRPADAASDNRLLRDLQRLLERALDPVARALERFDTVAIAPLAGLGPELALLLNAAALTLRLRAAGLPLCRPAIAPPDERVCDVHEGYHLGLALRLLGQAEAAPATAAAAVVRNPMRFDATTGRVWIVTGPNRGGKTTYTRAVGLVQVLAQAGLYVPASAARLSPIDALYTHFPQQESATPGRGRLDDEAARLATIFRRATPASLILLNEVLAGTSDAEALDLALDAVRGLRLLGARALYVTHLHELARRIAEINAQTPGDGVIGSLVAEAAPEAEASEAGAHRRTYRLRPGPPRGVSYASEIARQHGIAYAQLVDLLRERGILPPRSGCGEE